MRSRKYKTALPEVGQSNPMSMQAKPRSRSSFSTSRCRFNASSGGVLYPCTKKTRSSSLPGLGVAWATMASIHTFTPPTLCDGRGICSPSGTAKYEGALTDLPKVSVCESLLRTHKTKLLMVCFLSFDFLDSSLATRLDQPKVGSPTRQPWAE